MTYLNLMNNVLRRLREEETTSVTSTTYVKMVGDFINDAKTLVSQAADWSALRETLIIPTTASDNTYSLTGGADNIKVMSMINDTSNLFMDYRTKDWFNERLYIGSAVEGAPQFYTYNGLDSNGDTQILVGPTPDGEYNLRVDTVKRQGDLSANADVLLIPAQPVIHLAVALLTRERGESGGTSTAEYFTIANQYLSDAIAIDAAKHPEEMVFRTI